MKQEIRPVARDDEGDIAEICWLTVAPRPDIQLREVYVLKWTIPYVRHYGEYGRVAVADGRIAGYILSVPEVSTYEREVEPPYRDRAAGILHRLSGVLSQDSLRDLEASVVTPTGEIPGMKRILGEYPAHLHIDVHPGYQGRGLGRLLMDALLRHHRRIGTRGIHLIAGAENAGALAFYRRYGMDELSLRGGNDDLVVFGRKWG